MAMVTDIKEMKEYIDENVDLEELLVLIDVTKMDVLDLLTPQIQDHFDSLTDELGLDEEPLDVDVDDSDYYSGDDDPE